MLDKAQWAIHMILVEMGSARLQAGMLRVQMVGIWCVWMWQELGRPKRVRLVELGPGRGTLMADLLRSTAAFPEFACAVSVDLVEVRVACEVPGLLSQDQEVGTHRDTGTQSIWWWLMFRGQGSCEALACPAYGSSLTL